VSRTTAGAAFIERGPVALSKLGGRELSTIRGPLKPARVPRPIPNGFPVECNFTSGFSTRPTLLVDRPRPPPHRRSIDRRLRNGPTFSIQRSVRCWPNSSQATIDPATRIDDKIGFRLRRLSHHFVNISTPFSWMPSNSARNICAQGRSRVVPRSSNREPGPLSRVPRYFFGGDGWGRTGGRLLSLNGCPVPAGLGLPAGALSSLILSLL